MFRASGLIQGVHFGKLWRNGIRTELKLDTEVEFGAERIVMMHVFVTETVVCLRCVLLSDPSSLFFVSGKL